MNEEVRSEIEKLLKQEITEAKVVQLFYYIGKILQQNTVTYYELSILDSYLRDQYGMLISLSKKNLIRMMKFYQMSYTIPLSKLSKIDWNCYILLINKKDYTTLIQVCSQHHLNKRELENYLKTGRISKIAMHYKDPATEEFLKLQINLNKRSI